LSNEQTRTKLLLTIITNLLSTLFLPGKNTKKGILLPTIEAFPFKCAIDIRLTIYFLMMFQHQQLQWKGTTTTTTTTPSMIRKRKFHFHIWIIAFLTLPIQSSSSSSTYHSSSILRKFHHQFFRNILKGRIFTTSLTKNDNHNNNNNDDDDLSKDTKRHDEIEDKEPMEYNVTVPTAVETTRTPTAIPTDQTTNIPSTIVFGTNIPTITPTIYMPSMIDDDQSNLPSFIPSGSSLPSGSFEPSLEPSGSTQPSGSFEPSLEPSGSSRPSGSSLPSLLPSDIPSLGDNLIDSSIPTLKGGVPMQLAPIPFLSTTTPPPTTPVSITNPAGVEQPQQLSPIPLIPASTSTTLPTHTTTSSSSSRAKDLILQKLTTNQEMLDDPNTPQYQAFETMMTAHPEWENPTTEDTPEWEMNILQYYGLVTLYYATMGDSWNDTTGWSSDQSPCEWVGVQCYSNDDSIPRIQNLTLREMGLRGSIPSEIRGLTELRKLQLYTFRFDSILVIFHAATH
jgi:hypothetical protein